MHFDNAHQREVCAHAFVRASRAFAPALLLILVACGELEIGSYGGAPTDSRSIEGSGGGSDAPSSAGSQNGTSAAAGTMDPRGYVGSAGSSAEGSSSSSGGTGPLAGGARFADIGDTGAVGRARLDGGTYVVEGSGADIENGADGFHYLYESLAGDGQIVARVVDVVSPNSWTKVGVMIRDGLAPESKNAFMLLRPDLGSAFQHRPEHGVGTVSTWQEEPADFTREHNVRYLRPPKWLKLTRLGNVFTAYSSDDGKCWWQRWSEELSFDGSEALFGVALSAGSHGDVATASVTNFSVESTIEPHNAKCGRAQADGDLPVPTAEYWIVPPSRFGGSGWDYTMNNPNGSSPIAKCDPWAEDAPYGWIAPRTDGPDHPNCPHEQGPDWTLREFVPDDSWELDHKVGIGAAAIQPSDALSTLADGRGIWLRKKFSLTSHTQKSTLVLWGRWSDGITVYVNGVLATSNHSGTDEYKYLGLSDEARRALVVGEENVIAVRLEWNRYYFGDDGVTEGDAWDRYFDVGLTTNDRLAGVPLMRAKEPNLGVTDYVNTLKEFVQEQGISGATFAISKNGAIVSSAGFGWTDKNLDVPMPRDARLRLAGNDEVITEAAIAKLVNDGLLDPWTPVFPLLDLEPVPGHKPGSNVDLITVEDLRADKSGLGATTHYQSILDELAFEFRISPEQWTSEHNARWLYSLDATNVGSPGGSSRDAHFLLRFLAERLVSPQTLEEYLTEDMGLGDITVSHERLIGREPNEGYITRQPTWDRWLELESYLALSASAEAYASFFDDFALWYELTPEGSYRPGGGGAWVAAMPGTWSVVMVDPLRALSIVMITNGHGNFDEVITRLNRITYDGSPCLFGAVDPRQHLEHYLFIQNAAEPEHYVNIEAGLAASPMLSGNWSAQWLFEPVDDGAFRLKNRWTEQYLYVERGDLQVGYIHPTLVRTEWKLVPLGDTFQLENRAEGQVLTFEAGVLGASAGAGGANAEWRFCN